MIPPLLRATIDLGSSRTKGFWKLENTSGTMQGFFNMSPLANECIEESYRKASLADRGTNYIRWCDRSWIVGTNASRLPHTTIETERKADKASVRIAAALGMINREIPDCKPTLELKILLPLDEIGDERLVRDRIFEGIYDLGCDGKPIEYSSVHSCSVFPEGRGLLNWCKSDPGCLLIFGHRDLTLIWVQDGSIVRSKSRTLAGWGFISLMRQCDYSFKDELDAARHLYWAGSDLESPELSNIAKTPDDLRELQQKLGQARALVWSKIARQLDSLGISQCGAVIASGGSASYWKPELLEMHKGMDFCPKHIKDMLKTFDMKKSPMMFRALDCYGLHIMRSVDDAQKI